MESVFPGTSANIPTHTRNIMAILFNLQRPTQSGLWLLNYSEDTQYQLLHTAFDPGRLDKIFTSHLHGSHLFGLPGLLCSRSILGIIQPLTIYGPHGIHEFVGATLRINSSWTGYPLKVVEIDAGGISDDGLRKVIVYPMEHPLECCGYCIEEHDRPGAPDTWALKATGVLPGPLFRELKASKTIMPNDGRQINGADYLAVPVPSGTLAVLGDTGPCDAVLELAKGVSVMVHEMTLDMAMEAKASSHGHNSTRQAAALTREAGVDKLIITHISSRHDDKGYQYLLCRCRSIFPTTKLTNDFAMFSI